ncbi:BON domain-containing protein [Phenylobacterium sp. J426]|uniref:BON domain-containing protein n=1 Tax=Phenylobacterium sp. J426 TaxID=2898439 RepID=UPI0021517ABC|nr:BON domain-containing protein [Phenylobacterium sp. J426]MCR5873476.1 BON domain-containing protein [Phenylobacterium sp. J426]
MSEWNRNDRDMRRFESDDRTRDWEDGDRNYRGQGGRGGREPRSFYGGESGQSYSGQSHSGQGSSGQGYGYGERQNRGAPGYAQSGQGYGGQSYGQGYGGAGHPGQSYGSGESHGQSGQSFGQQTWGGRSFGGQDRRGGHGGGHGDWEHDRRDQRYGGSSGYGHSHGESGGQFGDANEEVRRVADGDEPSGMRRMFGAIGMGQHRGKGPKNYTRSDDRIRDDVNDRLADDSWLDASEIDVAVSNCEVTLTGTVDSREDKRRAEDLAEQVSGVKHVQNNLRIQSQSSSSAMGSSMQGSSTTGSSTTGSSTTGAAGSGVGDRSSLASGTTSTGSTVGSNKTN